MLLTANAPHSNRFKDFTKWVSVYDEIKRFRARRHVSRQTRGCARSPSAGGRFGPVSCLEELAQWAVPLLRSERSDESPERPFVGSQNFIMKRNALRCSGWNHRCENSPLRGLTSGTSGFSFEVSKKYLSHFCLSASLATLAMEHGQVDSRQSPGIPCAKGVAEDRRPRFGDRRPPSRNPPA
jgi:hypothetical protein